MSFESLFSGVNFASTVRKYCAANGWNIADLNDSCATLRFTVNSKRTKTIFIIRYDLTIEFSVQSMAIFDSHDEIPHFLSTLLLERNAEKKIGFWCIEKIKNKFIYSCMHNAKIQLLDKDHFADIVNTLINECDDFEEKIETMVNS